MTPTFNQLNIVVDDMTATLEFYRRLGIEIPDPPEWPAGSGALHVEIVTPDGSRLEFDNMAMGKVWHEGWRTSETGPRAVIGFGVATREAVDERYNELVAAGNEGRQPPYDTFWGARYAIVADPNGYDVGIMSPVDKSLTYKPEV